MKALANLAHLIIACAVFASPAAADIVSHSYTGTIIEVMGPQAAEAPVGATINVSYSVDAGTNDENSLPDQGIFFDALQSLRIELPGRNLSLLVTGGTVQTFDNNVLSGVTLTDQVLMFGGDIDPSSAFGGMPVLDMQLIFLEVTPLDTTPTMLDGDVFPAEPIAAPQVLLELQTSVGFVTTLRFQLEPTEPTVADVVTDARLRIDALVDQGQLGAGVARSIGAKLDAVLAASTAERNGVCGPLAGLRNQVGNLPRRTPAELEVAEELGALVTALTQAAGGCGA